jgi:hypothetical protein
LNGKLITAEANNSERKAKSNRTRNVMKVDASNIESGFLGVMATNLGLTMQMFLIGFWIPWRHGALAANSG